MRPHSSEIALEPRTADFDYELPAELVARRPAERRDGSRLLVLHRNSGAVEDSRFSEFPGFFQPGDVLVLNDTKVFPARLLGHKPTGAPAEVFLLRPRTTRGEPDRHWEALVRPGGKLKPGREVTIAPDFQVRVEDSLEGGARLVTLVCEGDPWESILEHGAVPLPPYMERESDDEDRVRYQTVYAREPGSVAAPTAGLHLTEAMLAGLERSGVNVHRVTLHVGLGTFRPVDCDRVEDHRMHAEWYSVGAETASELTRAKREGRRIWSVGTTTARVLETVVREDGGFEEGSGWTELFIFPPYEFRAVDRLLTNFHLPRSSLLMLVSALAGRTHVLAAYEHAIRQRYRFYSYGDAMLIL